MDSVSLGGARHSFTSRQGGGCSWPPLVAVFKVPRSRLPETHRPTFVLGFVQQVLRVCFVPQSGAEGYKEAYNLIAALRALSRSPWEGKKEIYENDF